jgi:hypothetical protein
MMAIATQRGFCYYLVIYLSSELRCRGTACIDRDTSSSLRPSHSVVGWMETQAGGPALDEKRVDWT